MPKPLVSIIVPAFNRSGCIANALASIQAQTYDSWEAIVVDDGSTDTTPVVVEELGRQDPRIRLVRHDRNRGAQAARNSGINAASGDWVAFLDSDDTYVPDSLEVRLRVAQEENVSVVHSGGDVLYEDGVPKRYYVPPLSGRVYERLLETEGPLFPALLIARAALRRIGGLDDSILAFQEWDTVLSLAKHYDFGFVPASTFIYDCRGADTMSRNYIRAGIGYEQVFRKRLFDILRVGGPGALARHYRQASAWYQKAGATSAVRRCGVMARFWSCLDARGLWRKLREIVR